MENHIQSEGQTQNVSKKAWYKKWWVIVLLIIGVLMIIGSMGDSPTPTAESDNKKEEVTKEPETMIPELTLTSVDLAKEYSENEVAADAKYKGKVLEVSGKIVAIDNGILDNEMIVKLSDGQYDISAIYCYTQESEKDEVLNLKKGQQVALIGKGDSATLKSPVLRDCILK